MLDYIDLYNIRDKAQATYEASLPICANCRETINGEFLYEFDGELFCEDCFNDEFRKPVDNYIKDPLG